MRTADRLAAAIREAGSEERHERLAKKAEEGYFDDFLSPLACPISALVKSARQIALHGIADRAINGEFDATSEEADAWFQSDEAQALFRER